MARQRSDGGENPKLGDFLHQLSEDPELLASYKRDRRGTMQAHGLSDEHQQILESGNVQAARDAVEAESGGRFQVRMFVS
jgi:hypothetical protein